MTDTIDFLNEKNHSIEKEKLKLFSKKLKEKYQIEQLFVFLTKDFKIELALIAFKPENQGNGNGTKAMNELIDYADNKHFPIILDTATPDLIYGTTSKSRLKKFYKNFGFVENKGRNKDFSLSCEMYRNPNQIIQSNKIKRGLK